MSLHTCTQQPFIVIIAFVRQCFLIDGGLSCLLSLPCRKRLRTLVISTSLLSLVDIEVKRHKRLRLAECS